LVTYVQGGGRLIIEGGHIGFCHKAVTAFASTVLHIQNLYVYTDVGDITLKNSHPIATTPNSLPDTIGFTPSNTPGDSNPDADAVRILEDAVGVYGWTSVKYGGSPVGVAEICRCVVAYDDDNNVSNGGQIVFFAIDIDDINSITIQNQLIENAVTWLATSANDVGIESINTPLDGGQYSSGIIEINATVKNYGTTSQSNFNVSCKIVEIESQKTMLSEDFNGGVLPPGWSTILANPPNGPWVPTNNGTRYGPIVGSSDYGFVCDSDLAGAVSVNSWLVTPHLNCTSYDIIELEFTHRYDRHSEVPPGGIYVVVAIDGEIDIYDPIAFYYWQGDIALETKTIDISGWAAGYSDVLIGFEYVAHWDEHWIIDDVIVRGRNEKIIYDSNQTITATLYPGDMITVNWTFNFANTTDYRIYVTTWLSGDDNSNNQLMHVITITTTYLVNMIEGWNFITLPLYTSYARAEDLAKAIPNCTHISEWNISTSSFVSHQRGTDVNNFTINDGVGYMVYVEGDTLFEVNGVKILPVTISLQQSWNSIGWFNETSTDAESLTQNVTNCTAIAYWNNTLYRFIVHPVGADISNFRIEKGVGYLIYVSTSSIWENK
jgi:hypothetical protein